jgi:hypothetical protein
MGLYFWDFIKMEKNCCENLLTEAGSSDIISHAFKRDLERNECGSIDVPEQLKSGKEQRVTHNIPVNW